MHSGECYNIAMNHDKTYPIFIEKKEETQYFKDFGINIKKLDNGILLGGIHRSINDSYACNVIFYFQTGAYFDPEKKKGLAHLLEHIISYIPDQISKDNNISYNASTSYDHIKINLSGIANPHVKEYGIWPVIDALSKIFQDPFSLPHIEELLLREKKVIQREIHEVIPKRLRSFYKFTDDVMFEKNHPYNLFPTGTEEEVNSISMDDIKKYFQSFFDPQKLIVRVIAEGPENTAVLLNEYLEKSLKNIKKN
jgi:predicted Zn-dependent peptidase